MIETFVGLARYNEHGTQTGGLPGDQLQVNVPDPNGELALIPLADFIGESKATIYRTVDYRYSNKIGAGIVKACNNPYIGYDVNNRLSILAYGIFTGKNGKGAECDNSSLARVVIKYGTDIDLGDFTNSNVRYVFEYSKIFLDPIEVTDSTVVYLGDVVVLEGTNQIAIVGIGTPRSVPSDYDIDYDRDIKNKPSINGETVEGHKTQDDYHITGGGGSIPTVDGEKLVF